MKTIASTALAMSLAAAVAAVAASPVSAAARAKHPNPGTYAGPMALYGARMAADGVVYSVMGTPIPSYVLSTPNACWVDGGYGRWSTCEGGN